MIKRTIGAATLATLLLSCSGGSRDLAVVGAALKSDINASMAGGPDLGVSVPSSGSIYWVEGSIKNGGKEEVTNVSVSFRVTDGNTKMVLTASIPSVPPGRTVPFRTSSQGSRLSMKLLDEEPDIRVGK
jgi:hypothetical protein